MSNQNIPTIQIEPIDPDQKLTLSDLVELGEQIFSEIQKSKSGESIEVPEEPAPAPAKSKNIAALTGSGIVLIAGAMLAKKLLF